MPKRHAISNFSVIAVVELLFVDFELFFLALAITAASVISESRRKISVKGRGSFYFVSSRSSLGRFFIYMLRMWSSESSKSFTVSTQFLAARSKTDSRLRWEIIM